MSLLGHPPLIPWVQCLQASSPNSTPSLLTARAPTCSRSCQSTPSYHWCHHHPREQGRVCDESKVRRLWLCVTVLGARDCACGKGMLLLPLPVSWPSSSDLWPASLSSMRMLCGKVYGVALQKAWCVLSLPFVTLWRAGPGRQHDDDDDVPQPPALPDPLPLLRPEE